MKVVVFGATGSIGKELVKQALEQGHQVTAFVRNPAKLSLSNPRLQLAQGDILDYEAVEKAVKGQNTVLCAIGDGANGVIRFKGTSNIVQAMTATHSRRLVCQTTLGVGDSWELLTFFWKRVMFGLLLRKAFQDHILQERCIKQSQLDWIIVRPAAFTDGSRTGNYQYGFTATQKGLELKISRADVADFMLKQLSDNSYLHQTPGLSY